ncbi:hypothetical protein CHS0354_042564 [Potamilus streckersoni]|uniref:Macro domain-containing protein n=1 Tax=Potamilus streckersoni TaxID=2493646 RepID=A0AAE0TET5_9BIVA|nr:hypothetical protein CHS0354_042564 [Potamilus streckersoni]
MEVTRISTWSEYCEKYNYTVQDSEQTLIENQEILDNGTEREPGKPIFPARREVNDKISVLKANITNLHVDAIVSSANKNLANCAPVGVSLAISNAAGPCLWKACQRIGKCRTGTAVITDGFNLNAKYVIHAIGPDPNEADEDILRQCYNAVLRFIPEKRLRTVAIPCLCSGFRGFPLQKSAAVALTSIRHWLDNDDNRNMVDRIIFCLYTNDQWAVYFPLLRVVFPSGPELPRLNGEDISSFGRYSRTSGIFTFLFENTDMEDVFPYVKQATVSKFHHPEADGPDLYSNGAIITLDVYGSSKIFLYQCRSFPAIEFCLVRFGTNKEPVQKQCFEVRDFITSTIIKYLPKRATFQTYIKCEQSTFEDGLDTKHGVWKVEKLRNTTEEELPCFHSNLSDTHMIHPNKYLHTWFKYEVTFEKHPVELLDLDRTPTDKDLEQISEGLGASHSIIALQLGVPATAVQRCIHNHPHDAIMQGFQMLLYWRDNIGRGVTLSELLHEIEKCGCSVDIDSLKQGLCDKSRTDKTWKEKRKTKQREPFTTISKNETEIN